MLFKVVVFENSPSISTLNNLYLRLLKAHYMIKYRSSLPRERLAKWTEIPLEVQALVQAVKKTPIKDLIQTLQVLLPLLLSFLVDSMPFIFQSVTFSLPIGVEHPIRHHHYAGIIIFVL